MTELLLRDHPGTTLRDVCSAANLYRNSFKHVGATEPELCENQNILDQFDDTKNDYLLYICVENYVRLRKAMPVPFQVYQAWFCALHLELLQLSKVEIYSRAFPGIRNLSRVEQKRMGADQILK